MYIVSLLLPFGGEGRIWNYLSPKLSWICLGKSQLWGSKSDQYELIIKPRAKGTPFHSNLLNYAGDLPAFTTPCGYNFNISSAEGKILGVTAYGCFRAFPTLGHFLL